MTFVLIIDPYPVARRGLRQTLTEEFRDVAFGEAGNAKEALLAVAKRPWDIVILDIAMPDRDGFELLREISGSAPKSKVLVLSAYVESEEGTHCMQLGAYGYISKRTSLSELVKAVRNVVAGRKY